MLKTLELKFSKQICGNACVHTKNKCRDRSSVPQSGSIDVSIAEHSDRVCSASLKILSIST